MLHRNGPFDQEGLVRALSGYLPLNSNGDLQVYDVEYADDDLEKLMVANFIWLNSQWVFIDVREKD